MLRRFYMKAAFAPCILAILLGSVVFAAPIVNGNGRPPRAVFLILPETVTPPEVSIEAEALGKGRYLLTLHASAFVFTDLCVTDADAIPVGHAHVHVNGEKVASAYAPIIEIGPLSPGQHKIDVDRKSTRLNSSHPSRPRMPSSA